ncbi:hypothetical protein ACLB2K_037709 [Fragaria x ananassa]
MKKLGRNLGLRSPAAGHRPPDSGHRIFPDRQIPVTGFSPIGVAPGSDRRSGEVEEGLDAVAGVGDLVWCGGGEVSSTTAASLLDMISGLNALLSLNCMAGKDEIQKLRKENEDLRAKSKHILEWKIPVKMILYPIALMLMLLMSYLALR